MDFQLELTRLEGLSANTPSIGICHADPDREPLGSCFQQFFFVRSSSSSLCFVLNMERSFVNLRSNPPIFALDNKSIFAFAHLVSNALCNSNPRCFFLFVRSLDGLLSKLRTFSPVSQPIHTLLGISISRALLGTSISRPIPTLLGTASTADSYSTLLRQFRSDTRIVFFFSY